MKRFLAFAQAFIFFAALASPLTAGSAPLKIYILAGQSNMQGSRQDSDLRLHR